MELYYKLPNIEYLYEESERHKNDILEIGFKIASSFIIDDNPNAMTYMTTCLYVAHWFVSECHFDDEFHIKHPHHLGENNDFLVFINFFSDYGLHVLRSCGFLRERRKFVVVVSLTEILVMDENCFTDILHTLFRKNLFDKGTLTEYWKMLTPLELKNVTALHHCVSFSKSNADSIYTNFSINYVQLHITEENNGNSITETQIAINELINREMNEQINVHTDEGADGDASALINLLDDIQHVSFEQDRERTIETLYNRHSEPTFIETTVSKFDKEECCVCLSEPSEYMCPHCNAKICKECFNELRIRNCECPACRIALTKIIQCDSSGNPDDLNDDEHGDNEHVKS